MAVQFAKEKLGMTAGASVQGNIASNYQSFGGMYNPFSLEKAQEIDLDGREDSYLKPDM
jgi:hypothetical protein